MACHWWSRPFIFMVLGTSLVGAQSGTPASTDPPQPTQQACGTIVNDPNGAFVFDATLVHECLTSVPFNAAIATRFLKYYNDTLSFQSTLSYLKSPPSTYQQPSVDLLGGIQSLQDAVNSGSFANQYEFEVALQLLLINAHDDHLFLNAGILSAFSFGSPFDIVSVSADGVETPKVYVGIDVFKSNAFSAFEPSAIQTINGQNATEYLETFAAGNVAGSVDPHTDWNRLMFSFAQDIQGIFNVFSGLTPFYPGENITIQLENGTTITERNLGIYWSQGPTGPLETGGDFYNFFVLGFLPASFDASSEFADPTTVDEPSTTVPTQVTVTPSPSPLSWNSPAYPAIPDVAQPDLGTFGGGVISGYFLNSSSVSVLSIPSFDVFGAALSTAQTTVNDFIKRTQEAGLQKVVIDLQGNRGGQVLLAVDTFKRFFPAIEPFGGSRLRATHATNVMGETITDYFNQLPVTDPDHSVLSTVEWVATTRVDADTDSNFTSWSQFFGPVVSSDDVFTKTQRFNLSNEVFVDNLIDNEGNFSLITAPTQGTAPFAPEDIIILTDGDCSSACALFVEMMHHEAGVRTVAVGGRAVTGPMQAVGGTRGARSLSTNILDNNINFARQLLVGTSEAEFLPNRTSGLDVFIVGGGVNLRDQVRAGETTPLQFAYDAADCRVYYTPATVFNYTALWQYAADAIWTNPGLCVAGSTGYANSSSSSGAGTNSNGTTKAAPVSNAVPFNLADHVTIDPAKADSTADVDDAGELAGDLIADGSTRASIRFAECGSVTSLGFMCVSVQRCVGDKARTPTAVPSCTAPASGSSCFAGTGPGACVLTSDVPEFDPEAPAIPLFVGACVPFPAQCSGGRVAGLSQAGGLATATTATQFAAPNRAFGPGQGLGAGAGAGAGVGVGAGPGTRFPAPVGRAPVGRVGVAPAPRRPGVRA
ncbi:hypothetical protein F4859DRAFT_477484 [Xylaria cf. heliscus]|nr:hypothetical protein F4859DRAFT_477484 [Xylaria cf. heliscus]